MTVNGVQNDNRQALHNSRLVEWVLNKLGQALLASIGVAFVFGVIAALGQQIGWLWGGALGGPLAFACVLGAAKAPKPPSE